MSACMLVGYSMSKKISSKVHSSIPENILSESTTAISSPKDAVTASDSEDDIICSAPTTNVVISSTLSSADQNISLSSTTTSNENPACEPDPSVLSVPSSPISSSAVSVISNKNLPKPGTKISFKLASDSDWRTCTVINRGGKASTSSWHFLNIKEGEEKRCISFKTEL